MGKNGPIQYRRYTEEFRIEAVRLGNSVGVSTAAKRLGVPEASLWNWIRRSRGGKLELDNHPRSVKRNLAEFEAENRRLRAELDSTRQDLEIVKKAAAYFAKES